MPHVAFLISIPILFCSIVFLRQQMKANKEVMQKTKTIYDNTIDRKAMDEAFERNKF